jgi:hypothetical protein
MYVVCGFRVPAANGDLIKKHDFSTRVGKEFEEIMTRKP